jgi:hypothetical protein
MRFFNKTIRENFVVVSITSDLSLDFRAHEVIKPLIEASDSSFWEMINPEGYVIYFLSRESNSREKATSLKSQIDKLITSDHHFKLFECHINEGPLVTTINWWGKVTSRPLGNAANMITNDQDRH